MSEHEKDHPSPPQEEQQQPHQEDEVEHQQWWAELQRLVTIENLSGWNNGDTFDVEGSVDPFMSLPCPPPHQRTWREKVVLWCYSVSDHFRLPRSVVYIAMNILDRTTVVLSTRTNDFVMDERNYQVAVMTALFMASRIVVVQNGAHNNNNNQNNTDSCAGTKRKRPAMTIADLLSLHRIHHHQQGDNVMQCQPLRSKDIVNMGGQMVGILQESTPMVTPHQFLLALINLLPSSYAAGTNHQHVHNRKSIVESACYLVEIAVCHMDLTRCQPSHLAVAALLNSMPGQTSTREAFSRAVTRATGIRVSHSPSIQAMCTVLQGMFQQSSENEQQQQEGHLQEDKEEEGNDDDNGKQSEAGLVHVVPHFLMADDDQRSRSKEKSESLQQVDAGNNLARTVSVDHFCTTTTTRTTTRT